MTLPVRRRGASGGLAERRSPGWSTDPLAEFNDLFGRLGSLMESAFGGPLASVAEGMAWSPSADIEESDDAYFIEVDVPGVKRDDINVEMNDREISITGEYKERERTGVLRRSTRRTGRFEYRTLLPGEISTEGVDATLSDGVLTVKVPKAEAAKPRRIEITAGE
ncbi:Hsp20/alpha crystallin family protein [Streptomyces ipomoeae]|jgi:HSP20 family protein|uniref:Hsp20/alpha crystallin family protein n=2 Tax=Streptomyces ipomoeae TaxID=103232 RepID=L1KXF5_9ACTN|nr:Hsp20/alpha crystallin family protein [Streptomyces ipomoeae]EKX65234.1 Hsp20/alpha crystallin family protein [Streptomyces ipomoeae 91-03]MDX2694169.1 Hsp20/alpha crystallin family protein [Streptomyces ipomoeae]MDX2821275.1 Hsp20/alpha crystallin family protein [Streptomyces ipomoeae]MDX2840089.1 Hsp20/alpha crystallin family protein [Streptomyces ipomoeae]MDX2873831.1 Hsp20/alpha crystallin family protein [Streptomyces ipomoeae]